MASKQFTLDGSNLVLDRWTESPSRGVPSIDALPQGWHEWFRGMGDTLERAEREREEVTRALTRTTTELREQLVELEALRVARSAAESATLIRGQILATVSRSMRAPADAMLGLSGLLRLSTLPPEQRGYVDAMHAAAEALRSILNEVSDLSRLESGTLPLEPIDFDFGVMLDDLLATLGATARTKGITLGLGWQGATPRRVRGDPGRIRQVLAALIRSALTRLSGGDIMLELGEEPGFEHGLRIVVEDSGPAIPDDLLPTLFDPFIRSDVDAGHDGGLALPIARQLTTLMGGDLAVENPPGRGTRFTLRLPLARVGPEPVLSVAPVERLSDPALLLQESLLVVEADAHLRSRWVTVSEASGFRASGAKDRDAAIAELVQRAAAGRRVSVVVFSDHDAQDYEQVGRRIIDDESLGRPALIMLPAAGTPGDAKRLMDAGFRGYLVKPVVPADLRELLETLRRTPRTQWHTVFLTRHWLAEARSGRVPSEPDLTP
jgi:signal transduction histidine kinase